MVLRIGIICPSEIAFRRFMPALVKTNLFEFAGISIASSEEWFGEKLSTTNEIDIKNQLDNEYDKAMQFINQYGGKIFSSYEELITSQSIDAIYIPLPPALHYKWAELALNNGKHVLLEKPATCNLIDTNKVIELAKSKSLALYENYMFVYHNQIAAIDNIIKSKEIGDLRLIRINFGFPKRASNDFRYNKSLGGGALLDCGGYTLRYATHLLGDTIRLTSATKNYTNEFEVDVFGSATLVNDLGVTAQVAFGMDNSYKCDLEVWGSLGTLYSGRILTAPVGYTTEVSIQKGNDIEVRQLCEDDTFTKSIIQFYKSINCDDIRLKIYDSIYKQAQLVNDFQIQSGEDNNE